MNYFFITGTSTGLGKALTELLLKSSDNFVYGISRNCTIHNDNYCHTILDLNNLDKVQSFQFPNLKNANKIVLINNAGIIGDIHHTGKIDNKKLIEAYNVNLIAPSIMINSFISIYDKNDVEKLIINISSGAGRTPIDGWNVYCASKSGIDMFSKVVNEEAKIDNNKIKILSLAPGIINSDMQVKIRNATKNSFSNLDKFIEYKKNGDLSNPNDTAKQVMQFIEQPNLANNVLCSVRDLN